MKIRTLDNKIFEGKDAQEICEMLWKSMFMPDENFELWMEGSARRAKNWNGALISCVNAQEHLDGLIRNEIVELLEG